MRFLILYCSLILLAALQSGCVGADAPKPDNDRIHGVMGVGVSNLNTSRIAPDRPYSIPPSSTSSTPSGPVLIPGSSSN